MSTSTQILIWVLFLLAAALPTYELAKHNREHHSHVAPVRCGDRPPLHELSDNA